jgi:hypothetical protein
MKQKDTKQNEGGCYVADYIITTTKMSHYPQQLIFVMTQKEDVKIAYATCHMLCLMLAQNLKTTQTQIVPSPICYMTQTMM